MKKKEIMKKRKRRGSIRLQIFMSYVMLIAFIVAVGGLSYQSASKAIISNYEDSSSQTLDMIGEYLGYGFDAVKSTAVNYLLDESINDYLAGKYLSDANERREFYNAQKDTLTAKATSDQFIKDIYFFTDKDYSISTNKNSVLDMYTEFTKTESGKVLKQEPNKYFWVADPSVIDEKFSVDQKNYAVRMIKKFYQIDAFLAIDIDRQKVADILNRLEINEGTVAFITQDHIAMDNTGAINKEITETEFYKKTLESEYVNGYIESVKYQGQDCLYLFSKVADTGTMVCALIPQSEILGQVSSIKYVAVVVVIVAALFAIVIGGIIFYKIYYSLRTVTKNMKVIAGGDFSVRINLKNRDEFGELSDGVDDMLESVSGILGYVKEIGKGVENSSNQVAVNSDKVMEDSSYISNSMNEIDDGLTSQAGDTEECARKMDSLAGLIEQVEVESKEIKNIAENTDASIRESIEEMNNLKDHAKETTVITKDVIDSIQKLNDKTKMINGIIQTISTIAEQTTLLSLNASIEAARAGEAGQGFSVVAGEIGKLAEQSGSAANQVENIINEISGMTVTVADVANQAGQIISQQESAMNDTVQAFDGMRQEVVRLIEKIGEINRNIQSMQGEKTETQEKIENISSVTEEVAASVSVVNSRTQNQLQNADDMLKVSKEMLEQVQKLEEAMRKFVV